jgi:hypothetical protein
MTSTAFPDILYGSDVEMGGSLTESFRLMSEEISPEVSILLIMGKSSLDSL